jgi:hypothetical protein
MSSKRDQECRPNTHSIQLSGPTFGPIFLSELSVICCSNQFNVMELDQILSCTKCHSKMDEPYTLECGHNVCLGCIRGSGQTVCAKCEIPSDDMQYNWVLKRIITNLDEGESIEDLLSCGVCWCLFNNPFFSRCGHTFCIGCLFEWKQKTSPDQPGPLCRAPMNELFSNNVLEKVIEAIAEASHC